jgi:YebC/PmpR family DNA-binding regulatory protein
VRAASMPKDNIERAIKKVAAGTDQSTYEEVIYEGYGPGNIAVVVEALTDNRNRTASSVRTLFNKNHASLGAANSVQYMFERKGSILLPKTTGTEDQMMEMILDAGADDLEDLGDEWLVTTSFEAFAPVRQFLEGKGIAPTSAELARVASQKVMLEDKETAEKAMGFVEALEDDDDVQKVFSNFDVSEAVLSQLQ